MPTESYREGDPARAPTGVTAEGISSRPIHQMDDQFVPSIGLPHMRVWELIGLCSVVAASPLFFLLACLFRTGRDLTVPYFNGLLVVLVIGVGLVVIGCWQHNSFRGGFGLASILFALGLGASCSTVMLWSGQKDLEFVIEVSDARTGKPVPNAVVSFSEGKERSVIAQTDREGKARIVWGYRTSGSTSPVCDTGSFVLFHVVLKASANGYAEIERPLADVAGHGWPLHAPPPPPIRIHLMPNR